MHKMRPRGGLYVWRTRKPWAPLGLPIIGRHVAYIGMTSSFRHREAQHLTGSTSYGTGPAPWADLRPAVYRIPLPDAWFRSDLGRTWVKLLETLLIWALLPVYNVTQQAPFNPRRVPKYWAIKERAARDKAPRATTWGMAVAKQLANLLVLGALVLVWWVVS